MELKIRRMRRFAIYSSLVIYVMILANILLFKYVSISELFDMDRTPFRSLNLVPLKSILHYFSGAFSLKIALMNVLGNIAIFVPMGIYLQWLRRNKGMLLSVLLLFLVALGVEITQYILGVGGSDVDDVLLNLVGGIAGILIYKILTHFYKKDEKIETAMLVFLLVIGLASVLILARYSPQSVFLKTTYKEVIQGEEYYFDFRNANVISGFVKFENGILTVKSYPQKYYEDSRKYYEYDKPKELSVIVDDHTKMSKLYIDYTYNKEETLLKYEKLAYEELKEISADTLVAFNVSEVNGKKVVRDLCVNYAKEEKE